MNTKEAAERLIDGLSKFWPGVERAMIISVVRSGLDSWRHEQDADLASFMSGYTTAVMQVHEAYGHHLDKLVKKSRQEARNDN